MFISLKRAICTKTKPNLHGTASFITTASSLQSQSLLYPAPKQACEAVFQSFFGSHQIIGLPLTMHFNLVIPGQ